jgi:hypothetical protein
VVIGVVSASVSVVVVVVVVSASASVVVVGQGEIRVVIWVAVPVAIPPTNLAARSAAAPPINSISMGLARDAPMAKSDDRAEPPDVTIHGRERRGPGQPDVQSRCTRFGHADEMASIIPMNLPRLLIAAAR